MLRYGTSALKILPPSKHFLNLLFRSFLDREGEVLLEVQLDTVDTMEPSLLWHTNSTTHTHTLLVLLTVVLLWWW